MAKMNISVTANSCLHTNVLVVRQSWLYRKEAWQFQENIGNASLVKHKVLLWGEGFEERDIYLSICCPHCQHNSDIIDWVTLSCGRFVQLWLNFAQG